MIEEQLQVGEVEPVEEQELLQRVASNEVMMGGVGSAVGNFISMNQNIAGIDVNTHSILKGFTFGTSDYTGAFKSGDIEWNKDTGAITGGSGIVMYRSGIVGASAGVTTFSINATTGAVALSGTITAAAGTIGGWTILTEYIYSLVSGTPTVTPSDGLVLKSGATSVITVYENTEKRVELGYLSAGVFGIKGYAANGTTVLFELSDTQIKAEWSLVSGTTNAPTDNADVTSANVAASIAGQGALALLSVVDTAEIAAGAVEAAKTALAAINSTTGNVAADHIVASMIDVVGLNGATGRIVVADATDANVVTAGINTHAVTLIGAGKILISGATVLSDWSSGADATKIDGGNIYTNTVTATQINVANLQAISADLGSITAGNITLDASGYIRGGQTAYRTGEGYWLGYSTTYKLSIKGTSGDEIYFDGEYIYHNGTRLAGNTMYGDGSDGNLTTSGDETLTKDTYYDTLTISNGDTFYPNGYRWFCKTKLINNGTIDRSGNGGANATNQFKGAGGAALASGTIMGSVAGGDGGDGNDVGANGTDAAVSIGVNGAAGGDGGGAVSGGTAGTATASPTKPRSYPFCIQLAHIADGVVPQLMESSAGSGGGGGADNGGGGGGAASGGGVMLIVAKEIENNGVIQANGGDGGDGDTFNNRGGGGGGGGSGGVIILVYNQYSGAGTKTVTGGAKGSGSFGTTTSGADGDDGNTGVLIPLQF